MFDLIWFAHTSFRGFPPDRDPGTVFRFIKPPERIYLCGRRGVIFSPDGHVPPQPIDRGLGAGSVGRCRCRRGATARCLLLQALDLVINTDRSARKGALITEAGSVWKRGKSIIAAFRATVGGQRRTCAERTGTGAAARWGGGGRVHAHAPHRRLLPIKSFPHPDQQLRLSSLSENKPRMRIHERFVHQRFDVLFWSFSLNLLTLFSLYSADDVNI